MEDFTCTPEEAKAFTENIIKLANPTPVEVMTFGSDGTMSVHPAIVRAFLAALPRFVPQTKLPDNFQSSSDYDKQCMMVDYRIALRNEFIDWIMQQFMENQDG